MKKPEILAPCGTWEALEAAVKAGADAVYVGGTLFSARAFAKNFDQEEMLRAIDYCHFYDVRIYMALNTLLKDDELGLVVKYMEPFYRAGLDAVIVQDFGVVKTLKDNFPDIPLHASTQMSVSSVNGAEFLKKMGFERVVPARELSLEETIKIKKQVDIEVESFVHGAMCFAYSGKCLLSSFIGGRSGNRGRCAQPCRQRFSLKNEAGVQIADEYVMSLKDMCTLQDIGKLIDAGIDSFKIEGRMKKPEYVAAVTSAYKAAADMYLSGEYDEKKIEQSVLDMKDIYNRGGFESGYYFRQNGAEMLANKRPNHTGVLVGKIDNTAAPNVFVFLKEDVNAKDVLEIRDESSKGTLQSSPVELTSAAPGKKGQILSLKGKDFRHIRKGMSVYRIRNNRLIDRISDEIIAPEKYINASAVVEAHVGSPLIITIYKDDICACVSGEVVGKALNRPSDAAVVEEKMKKTGGSGIRLSVCAVIDSDAFIQMSELNALRRTAIEEFKKASVSRYRREN